MHYRVAGKGDPVIFLHGFLENSTMWDGIAPEFECLGFKTILIDLPCHGNTRFDDEICSMSFMAECVDALCSIEGIENPFVFGHSMGGYVGLELLKLRSIQLTLVHSNFWDDSLDKKLDRDRVVLVVEKNKMRLIQEAIPNLFATDSRERCKTNILKIMESAERIPANEIIAVTRGMRDRLHNKEILEANRISIIHGQLDTVVKTNKLMEEISQLNSQPKIQFIPDAGHMSIWERPAALIECLKANVTTKV